MWTLDANAFFWWKIMNIWICISYTFTHVLCFTFSSLKSSKKTTTPHPPKKPMSILSNKFLLTLPESNIAVKINGWEMKFLWEGRIFRCKLLLSGRAIPYIHPGKFTWNLKITRLKRKIIWTKPSFLKFHVNWSVQIAFSRPSKNFRPSGPCECRGGFCWRPHSSKLRSLGEEVGGDMVRWEGFSSWLHNFLGGVHPENWENAFPFWLSHIFQMGCFNHQLYFVCEKS